MTKNSIFTSILKVGAIPKGLFKNDVTRVGGYPKLVTKGDMEGRGQMQIVASPPKKVM